MEKNAEQGEKKISIKTKGTLCILGSNSFGGGWLVDQALNIGFDVIGLSRSVEPENIFLPYAKNSRREHFIHYQLDINRDIDKIITLLNKIRPKYIVDFAGQGMVAPSWQWPEHWYRTNVASKAKLINGVNDNDYCKKYLRVSTPEVYGSNDEMIEENTNYNPTTPYSISHAAIDMHLAAFFKQFSFPVILTRFANFYGSTQQMFRIVPRAFFSAADNHKLPLHGGGSSIRSFIHGKDVASGILLALEKGEVGRTYHFSTTEFTSIRNLVAKIAAISNVNFDDLVEITKDRVGKDAAYLMRADRARAELNWEPNYDLMTGLKETQIWVLENIEKIRTLNLEYQHQE